MLVQLFSLGLNRWADVVQTRNRGRTGGIRQAREKEPQSKALQSKTKLLRKRS